MGFDIWEDSLGHSRDIPILLPGKLAVCSEPLATELLPGPMGWWFPCPLIPQVLQQVSCRPFILQKETLDAWLDTQSVLKSALGAGPLVFFSTEPQCFSSEEGARHIPARRTTSLGESQEEGRKGHFSDWGLEWERIRRIKES